MNKKKMCNILHLFSHEYMLHEDSFLIWRYRARYVCARDERFDIMQACCRDEN